MKDREGDNIRLLHILDTIKEIESYLADNDFENFARNSMMRFACIKQMEIIGEASNHISDEVLILSGIKSLECAMFLYMNTLELTFMLFGALLKKIFLH